MYKKVLIIALNENWTGISRLPSGLDRAGFEVYALCPRKSFLAKTKYLKKAILYPTFTYSRSKLIYCWIVISILYFKPDLIVPGDEDSILALHSISNFFENIPFFFRISKIIRHSLTPSSFDSIILSKSDFQEQCKKWGLRSPENIILEDVSDALKNAKLFGYPVVLKHDSGYGGSGVYICENELDIKKHYFQIEKNKKFKNFKVYFKKMFFVSIFNHDNKISLQQYIEGQVGQSPFCAKNGEVFAFNPMIRRETYPGKTGPASVSEGYQNEDIEGFVKTVAENLQYTGFGSLEYMIENKTKKLFIIELNPRPTPTCHISNKFLTNDLCETFFKGLNLIPRDIRPFAPYSLAMFPSEKKRDPESPYFLTSYHDIPHDDPYLFRALDPK